MSESADMLDLDEVKIDPSWALRIPANLASRRLVLPFASIHGDVFVACADPDDAAALDAVARFTGRRPVPMRVNRTALEAALARIYGDGQAAQPVLREDVASAGVEDAVALADEVVRTAILRQASDIHLDPERDAFVIRLRVDGVMEEYRRLPSTIVPALTSRIKVMAGMDIAERRAPQDGAFTFRFGVSERVQALDIRVASLPTRHGERLTLRLLAAQDRRLSLDRLGMCAGDLAAMERVLARPHGLVLLTGPTGSGKSTTLYAAIQRIMADRLLNILTVEDPVEYEMPGVGQMEVDSADKVSFRKALRSLLRHDPDVIMIGEIRDGDSLDIAIKASLTGHLVLSTLHTNDALGVVPRLLDMGAMPHLIAATLRLSVAQRLVRRLCRRCRTPVALSEANADALGHPDAAGRTVYEPGGCIYCAGRGFTGRMGLFECAAMDGEIPSLVAGGRPADHIKAEMVRKGFRSLLDDACAKVFDGLTTVNEVLEVAATDV